MAEEVWRGHGCVRLFGGGKTTESRVYSRTARAWRSECSLFRSCLYDLIFSFLIPSPVPIAAAVAGLG